MDAVISELIKQAPAPAANVIIVIIFLRTIERMAADWRAFMSDMRKTQADDNSRLIVDLRALSELINSMSKSAAEHDTFVRQMFSSAMDEMRASRKANRRRNDV